MAKAPQSQPAPPPLLAYRGSVNAWECDENDHLNIRFFVQKAWQCAGALAAAIALPHAFQRNAAATLVPRDIHIRFLREARNADALSGYAGVLAISETAARILVELRHADGAPAAALTLAVEHVAVRTQEPFAWSRRAHAALEALQCAPPPHAAARGIDAERAPGPASLEAADRFGAALIGAGAFGAEECDVFGRMRPEIAIGRISDSIPNLLRPRMLAAIGPDVGVVAVEYRLAFRAWPAAGDLFHIRSATAAFDGKARLMTHWLLDPVSGAPWVTAQGVGLLFDRAARKAIALDRTQADAARGVFAPEMAL
ncbi:MAG: thioesterase family protein [Hyphomonadaceae bacterium]